MAANRDIDLALSIICIVSERGQTLTQYEIARLCGCSRNYIHIIERRALKKLEAIIQRHLYLYDYLRDDIDLPIGQLH